MTVDDKKPARVLMTGILHPTDGLPGCTFTVEEVEGESENVHVTLFSPYGAKQVVADTVCNQSYAGVWLLDRLDY